VFSSPTSFFIALLVFSSPTSFIYVCTMQLPINYPLFYTATILEWKHLLKPDKYKNIIIESLKYLVEDKRVEVFAFVIMSNHIHIIWRIANEHNKTKVQQSFLKYTAQKIILDLRKNHKQVLKHFYVGAKDRLYQIWERNSLSIEIHSYETMLQKMNYLHQNPVKAGICKNISDYKFSTASLYELDKTEWSFVSKWGYEN
jgi:putative transposase